MLEYGTTRRFKTREKRWNRVCFHLALVLVGFGVVRTKPTATYARNPKMFRAPLFWGVRPSEVRALPPTSRATGLVAFRVTTDRSRGRLVGRTKALACENHRMNATRLRSRVRSTPRPGGAVTARQSPASCGQVTVIEPSNGNGGDGNGDGGGNGNGGGNGGDGNGDGDGNGGTDDPQQAALPLPLLLLLLALAGLVVLSRR